MKDQVIMTKSGELGVAIPLFRCHHTDEIATLEGYSISVTKGKPLAYVIDAGPQWGDPILCNAEVCERNAEFLGEL